MVGSHVRAGSSAPPGEFEPVWLDRRWRQGSLTSVSACFSSPAAAPPETSSEEPGKASESPALTWDGDGLGVLLASRLRGDCARRESRSGDSDIRLCQSQNSEMQQKKLDRGTDSAISKRNLERSHLNQMRQAKTIRARTACKTAELFFGGCVIFRRDHPIFSIAIAGRCSIVRIQDEYGRIALLLLIQPSLQSYLTNQFNHEDD